MKRTFSILLLSFLSVATTSASESLLKLAQGKASPRITGAALARKQAQTYPQGEERDIHAGEAPPARMAVGLDEGLVARSTIISSGRYWTIVPRGAVLHVPKLYHNRVDSKRTGRLLPWRQFFAMNRSWITAQAVTMEEATGEQAISDKAKVSHHKVGRLVVAVLKGGPISVLKPRPKPEADDRVASRR